MVRTKTKSRDALRRWSGPCLTGPALASLMGPVMLLGSSGVKHATPLGWGHTLDVTRAMRSRAALGAAMIVAVVLIAGLAYWDAERESVAALQDFAQEQATLASALGAGLRIRATPDAALRQDDVLAEIRSIERAKSLAILVRPPGSTVLRATDGSEVSSPRLMDAVRDGQSVVRIPREEAAAFGLPARTALAGLSRVDAGGGDDLGHPGGRHGRARARSRAVGA